MPSPIRCDRCRFPSDLCLCPEIPRIEAPCRFLVLRHSAEREKLTNTARWAALALAGSEIVDYGLPELPPDLSALSAPGTVVLFPSPAPAPPLTAAPRLVVVPDGSWSQARRMMQRIPALRTLPRLGLPAAPERPRLRRPHLADGMSTLEAIAAALEVLGAPDAAARLLGVHTAAIERVLRLKGMSAAAAAAAAAPNQPSAR